MKNNHTSSFSGVSIALLMLAASSSLFGQAHFQSQASGSWSSASTWLLIAGSDADGIPDADDTVDVTAGITVTIGATAVDCATLLVAANATLSINGTGNVGVNADPGSATIYGTVTMSSSGRLTEQGTGTRSLLLGSGGKITISGSASNPSFDTYSFDPASTFEYTATASQNVLSGVVFGNLTIGGSGTKTVTPVPADTAFRSTGKLTVASGTSFDVSTAILHIYFDGDVENYGTINASVGITVQHMSGAHWINNGTYLPSTAPGFGYTPTTTFTNTEISGTPVAQTFYDLVIEGTTSALNNLIAGRNITIAPGATLNGGAGLTHQLSGNWTNNGTFNGGTCTVAFNGTANQNISASTFYNLVVNNTAGVTLTGNVSIAPAGVLTITNGTISTGAYTLAVNSTDPAALSPGSNKIVGTVSRAIGPGATGTYRFFSTNAFVIPGGAGNPTTITASVYPNTNPPNLGAGADTNMIVKRYYTINSSGTGPGFTYTLRLPYNQSEVRGNEVDYVFWRNSGSGWVNAGSAPPADTATNYVEQAGLTAFSDWTIAENTAPLPIQLASFSAGMVDSSSNVKLTWTTLSEINNYGFFIQRSFSNAATFDDLPDNFVQGNGTTLSPKHYTWVDRNVLPGKYFYRLKQVDLDGSFWLSDPVEVAVAAATNVNNGHAPEKFSLEQNYPNPFNPSTRIQFSVEKSGFTVLNVYNILGEEVATLFAGTAQAGTEYAVTFDATSLTNGAYFYKLTSGERTSLRKMLLLK